MTGTGHSDKIVGSAIAATRLSGKIVTGGMTASGASHQVVPMLASISFRTQNGLPQTR